MAKGESPAHKTIRENFKDKMRVILERGNTDPEVNHPDADDLLCEILTGLGYEDIIAVYHEIHKWYA